MDAYTDRSQPAASTDDRRESKERRDSKRGSKTWLIPAGVLAAAVALYFLVPGVREFGQEAYAVLGSGDRARTEQWVRGFGAWGPAAVLLLMVAQTVIPVIPSVLLMVVTVLAYGPLWGGLLTFGGLLLAAAVAFGLGRALGPATIDRLIGEKTERKVEEFVERYGAWGVVVARISPVVSTDAVSFVAGLVCMRFARFMLATAAGTLPLTALVAWLGEDIDRMQTGLIWISVVSLGAFAAWVIYDHRRRARAGA
jgi:uncharacterized membrane protein YdjX (TVP38/TMEM64 family)